MINLLHVEDNTGYADLVSDFLTDLGLNVTTANTPQEALDKLGSEEFDCVLSDYEMPEMNGLELLDEVRENYDSLPFILFTSHGSEDIASEAITAGVSDYIQKGSSKDDFELLAKRIKNTVSEYRARKQVQEREERYRKIVENSPYPIAVHRNGELIYCNDSLAELVNARSSREIIGRDVTEFVKDDYLDQAQARMEEIREGEITRGDEIKIETLDGDTCVIETTGVTVNFEGDTVIQTMVNDITEKRKMKKRIKRAENKYRRLVEQNLVGIYMLKNLEIDYMNPKAASIFGYEPSEVEGMDAFEIVAPEDKNLVEEMIRKRLDGKKQSAKYTFTGIRKDGERREIEVFGSLVEMDEGSAILGAMIDVTQEKERERNLLRYEKILETIEDGVYVLDEEGDLVMVNDAFLDMTGYSREEVLGGNVLFVAEEKEYEKGTDAIKDLEESGKSSMTYDVTLETKDGRSIICENRTNMFGDGATVGVIRDISNRVKKDKWFKSLIQNSRDIITVLSATGDIMYQNPSVERILGYEQETLLDETVFPYIHPGDREKVITKIRDGIREGRDIETVEFRFRHRNGGWRYLESRGINLLDDPAVEGIVVNSRDITERKQREKELERQKKNLDDFASVVSHDIRNPLNIAKARLDMERGGDNENLEKVNEMLVRMEDLIEDTLKLAKHGQTIGETEAVDLEKIARRAWFDVDTGEAEINVSDGLGKIEADEDRLLQLIENIYRNSVEHAKEDTSDLEVGFGPIYEDLGPVEVDLEPDDKGVDGVGVDGNGVDAGYLEGFFVEDNGDGIDDDMKKKIFEHGFSTAEGTGLGLSIVKSIAKAHGWEVICSDGVDGGIRFEIHTDQ
ncbi:MAG: PAS domain S-box protein [Halobacteria archaeon]